MQFNIPSVVLELGQKFEKAGFSLYLVGGSVRDLLLEKEQKDWDFTTDAQPEEILKIIPDGFYNNKFGTVGISTEIGILEITTMRKEGDYKDHRHPSVVGWTNNIDEDLARRDFTINAMALNISKTVIPTKVEGSQDDTIVDPFNGTNDLQNQIIKAVGDPNNRFQEDALRMMRAVRFSAQLNFKIEESTFEALKENKDLLHEIAWERIRDELFKLLATDNAYEGTVTLKDTGILEIILPELSRCFGVVQEGPKHDRIYDIGEHCLLSLKHCASTDPLVRFATLLHDIGKPDTYAVDKNDGNVTFYNHDVVGANISKNICRRFNLSKAQTDKVYKLIRWHMFTINEDQTDASIRRFIKNIGLENVDDMMALRVGDRLGGGTQKAVSWRMEKFRERIDQVMTKPFSITDLKINGKDVMETLNIPPGPKIGEILNELFQEVLDDSDKNNREYLIERLTKQNS
jgi:tRNA nucleotidyltransferase (CCA-adding enzyme)